MVRRQSRRLALRLFRARSRLRSRCAKTGRSTRWWMAAARIVPASRPRQSRSVPSSKQLRSALRAGEADPDGESPRATNLVTIEARPALASVVPIVSDTGEIEQEPGTEYFHISVRFLDGSLLSYLAEQYLLAGSALRLEPRDRIERDGGSACQELRHSHRLFRLAARATGPAYPDAHWPGAGRRPPPRRRHHRPSRAAASAAPRRNCRRARRKPSISPSTIR